MNGRVCLVGAGPGDPELLTVRAARLIGEAGAVLYDRLVTPEVLALAAPTAELIDVGKHEGQQERIQAEINARMLDCARRHALTVRLKSGDPFVFGRGAEEWAHLARHGVAVEVVPGVSSALALAALQGIPPTMRGVAAGFAVVTGHRADDDSTEWRRYALIDTLIVLMGVQRRASIARALIDAGRAASTPAAFIENGGARVVVTELDAIARGHVEVRAPAVFVIGEVVRCRELLLPALAELVA